VLDEYQQKGVVLKGFSWKFVVRMIDENVM